MDAKLVEMLKGMSREEKAAYFEKNKKSVLGLGELDNVNGGGGVVNDNPNSEDVMPNGRAWFSSFGYVCNGEKCCD